MKRIIHFQNIQPLQATSALGVNMSLFSFPAFICKRIMRILTILELLKNFLMKFMLFMYHTEVPLCCRNETFSITIIKITFVKICELSKYIVQLIKICIKVFCYIMNGIIATLILISSYYWVSSYRPQDQSMFFSQACLQAEFVARLECEMLFLYNLSQDSAAM